MKDISFTVDGYKIKATLFFPSKIKSLNPAVLFIHGWATDETHYIQRAQGVTEKGAICLTFDLRGQGKSEGKLNAFSRANHLQDAMSAYDFLLEQDYVDEERIGVCGVSYGAYLASILTSKRPIKWLALRVPALYKDDNFTFPTAKLIEENPKIFSQYGIKTQNNLALNALWNFTGELLLVESENDSLIPHKTVENYLASFNKPTHLTYTLMGNADHALSTPEMKSEFVRIISNWFAERFKSNNSQYLL